MIYIYSTQLTIFNFINVMVLWVFRSIGSSAKSHLPIQGAMLCLLIRRAVGLALLSEKQQVRSQEGWFAWLGAKSPLPSGQEDLKPVHMVRRTNSRISSVFSFIVKWGHLCLSEDRETVFEPEGWLKKTIFLYSLKGYIHRVDLLQKPCCTSSNLPSTL